MEDRHEVAGEHHVHEHATDDDDGRGFWACEPVELTRAAGGMMHGPCLSPGGDFQDCRFFPPSTEETRRN